MGRKKGSECSQTSAKVVKSKKKFRNPFKAAEKKPETPAPAPAPVPAPAPQSPVAVPAPESPTAVPDQSAARSASKKRRSRRNLSNYRSRYPPGDCDPPSDHERMNRRNYVPKVKEGWATVKWQEYPEAAKTAAVDFVNHYGEMGEAGIRAEFKKEIEGYKDAKYSDTAWRANPTKNREKNLVTCLDETRVLLENKRYINASWAYDLQWVDRKFIIAEKPMSPPFNVMTLDEFYQMLVDHSGKFILEFVETDELRGDPAKERFYPVDGHETCRLAGGRTVKNDCFERMNRLWITPGSCKENHDHRALISKWPGCLQSVVLRRVIHSEWKEKAVREVIRQLAIQEYNLPEKENYSIVLIDEYSGIGKAAQFAAIDGMGTILWKGNPAKHSLVEIIRWIRRCRNGAIRTEDEYLFVVQSLICILGDLMRNDERTKLLTQNTRIYFLKIKNM